MKGLDLKRKLKERQESNDSSSSLCSEDDTGDVSRALMEAISDHYQGNESHFIQDTVPTEPTMKELLLVEDKEKHQPSKKKTTKETATAPVEKGHPFISTESAPAPPDLGRGTPLHLPPGAVAIFPNGTARDASTMSVTTQQTPQQSPLIAAELVADQGNAVSAVAVKQGKEEADIVQLLRDRRICLILFGLIALTGTLAAGLTLGLTDREPSGQISGDSSDQAEGPSEDSALPEISGDTAANNRIFNNVVTPLLSRNSLDALRNQETPQAMAQTWLLDTHDLSSYSESRIIQRYSLSVFYYATGGELSWLDSHGWLDAQLHECSWFSKYDNGEFDPCRGDIFYALVLDNNDLKGAIPEDLFLLSDLGRLLASTEWFE